MKEKSIIDHFEEELKDKEKPPAEKKQRKVKDPKEEEEKQFRHLNGHILCCIDCETTGSEAGFHDLIEICVLPLNGRIEPFIKIPPFYCLLQPKRPENIDPKVYKKFKRKICKAQTDGVEPYQAADLFEEWFEKLNLPYTKRIQPLAQNWAHDYGFMKDWLGPETFKQLIDGRYRDLMSSALYCNDVADFKIEEYPYPKVNLEYICNQLRVPYETPHDPLCDCLVTAKCYRQMILGDR